MCRVTIQRLAAVVALLAATPVVAQPTYRDEHGRPIDPRLVQPPTPMTVAPPTDRFAPPPEPALPPLPQTSATLKSSGSGVVIGAHEVLTAAHVVRGCTTDITVRSSIISSLGYVVARDEKNDLAVVHSNDSLPAAVSFRDGPVREGDEVVAMGYPLPGMLASSVNLTTGTVSTVMGPGDNSSYLQISAPVQPGNSGRPLLDRSGHLIGIVTARLKDLETLRSTGAIPQNVNFALKTAVARTFLDSEHIGYKITGSEQQLSAAEVGEIARPFTIQIKCTSNIPEANTAPQAAPPPAQQATTLPECGSPRVINTLQNIGIRNRIAVYNTYASMVAATPDMEACRALVWSSAGKRWVNYTVTWTNRETDQIWVQVTGYSGQLW